MYNFNELLNSTNIHERDLAKRIQTLHQTLDQVVNSKSSYLDAALCRESTKEDALIDMVGYCKNMIEDIWETYDVDKQRNIKR